MNTQLNINNSKMINVPLTNSYLSSISSDNYSTITNLSESNENSDNCLKKIFKLALTL